MNFYKKYEIFMENKNISIDNKLKVINNKRLKRSTKFIYTKDIMISDIKEVIETIGKDIQWVNPKVIWSKEGYIDTNKKLTKWKDISESTLQKLIYDMNTIFIYGYGSNQFI